jgi:HlyD family secretion protein
VVDPSTLEFIADLDETDLSRISPGQKVVIILDAFPDNEIISQIESISYTPKQTTTGTTYEVTVTLPAAVMVNLRLGLNGTAEVILEEKPVVNTLPISALTYLDGTPQVYVKEGDNYTPLKIETGIENDGVVEIRSGLSEGDYVYFRQD